MYPTIRRHSLWATPFNALRDEIDRVFNDALPTEDSTVTGAYPVDIHEDENHVYVDAEMPGFKKDEIEVTLEKGVLTIAAERTVNDEQKGKSHLNERRYTRVARRFSLPNTVSEADVQARLEDGVLHLTLNKREEVKPRRIEVQ